MPTPFYHLSLAEDLLNFPGLPDPVRQFLSGERCAFLFGSTAPDVQVISGQSRQVTHFFDLPIQENAPQAWKLMLSEHPSLLHADRLPTAQAVFLAGYLCHLQADWIWVKEIFAPVFGPRCTWGTFRQRLDLHNVLRAYLDMHILPQLQQGMDYCLQQVEPDRWLPFVEDRSLVAWRNFISPQLSPGAVTQTVEVFSTRGGISATEFTAMLESEERMQAEVFTHLSLDQITRYHHRVLSDNSHMLSEVLAFSLHREYRFGIKYEGVSS